jgi:alkanesulfonate monooxygenase SsuD/methylene tetrahydromethanopterin reductase-like flavin-dependent oxidoreductase (luciferase family)
VAQVYQTTDQIADTFGYYRKLAADAGWQATPGSFILTRHIHVAETDAAARRAAEPAMRYFFSLLGRGFNEAVNDRAAEQQRLLSTLNTERSFSYFRPGNELRVNFATLSWDDLQASGYLICGSPDTVARELSRQLSQVGAEHFMGMFHIGNMAHSQVISSLELFQQQVVPQLSLHGVRERLGHDLR